MKNRIAAFFFLILPCCQVLVCDGVEAQEASTQPVFSQRHGYQDMPFMLEITSAGDSKIFYTLDCSTPTEQNGILYNGPIKVEHTSTFRAVAISASGDISAPTAATYIFLTDVLKQNNSPEGYPSEWGPFCNIEGNAPADYEMDPELVQDSIIAEKIKKGLLLLPVMSIITDRENLFSKERDDEKGGIYIYTGSDSLEYGRGWERPASIEFIPMNKDYGFQINCAIKIHGGGSRLPENSPKHSIRMKMKKAYGPGKLNYPLFGENGGSGFNQIVIRAGYCNTWYHPWDLEPRRALYTRDAWVKKMMASRGHLASETRFAHLFINGMYWGVYNPTERVDEDFCTLHKGGKGKEWDVIKAEKSILEPVAGSLDDYMRLVNGAENSSDYGIYQRLRGLNKDGSKLDSVDVLFNDDNFIDYMLLNYYGGNTDWDEHNWTAVRRHGSQEGFSFVPWDSERIMMDLYEDVFPRRFQYCPTWLFDQLMNKCKAFRFHFIDRAYEALCEPYGFLSNDNARNVWEDLSSEVELALWAESARWGDYRRDVHVLPPNKIGDLFTPDNYYHDYCEFMRNDYFPRRPDILFHQLIEKGYWSAIKEPPVLLVDNDTVKEKRNSVENGQIISLRSDYDIYYTLDATDPVQFNTNGDPYISPKAILYNQSILISDNTTIKARSYCAELGWSPLMERSLDINNSNSILDVPKITYNKDVYYDLQGRTVLHPQKGLYIREGRKVVVN